jgi:hypothetical protein
MAAPLELGPRGGAEKEEEPDLEALVAAFLADECRATLELPRMSAGQRKQAKRLVEQHPGLRCESFGFGQERQLHLFKPSHEATREASSAAPAASMATPGTPSPAGPPPPALLSPRVARPDAAAAAVVDGDPASAGEGNHWEKASTGACSTEKAPTEACSTGASTPGTPSFSPRGGSGQLRHSGFGGPSGLATPLGIAAVRNTFIHFEGAKEDDRLVQSLPHGMFRQQLQAEGFGEAELVLSPPRLSPATREHQPEATDEKELPPPAAFDVMLPPGVEVEIGGLSKCPAFNGRRGVVQSYDPEAGRYDVALWSETGEQRAKVRRENLAPIAPPSPVAVPLSPLAFCGAAVPGGLLLATQSPGQILQAR